MSVINQMLRELDARQHEGNTSPPVAVLQKPAPRQWGGLYRVVAGLLLAACLVWFALWSGTSGNTEPAKANSGVTQSQAFTGEFKSTAPAGSPAIVQIAQQDAHPATRGTNMRPIASVAVQNASRSERPVLPSAREHSSDVASNPETVAPTAVAVQPEQIKPGAINSESEIRQLFEEAEFANRKGDKDLARQLYRKVLQRNPGLEAASLALVSLLLEHGEKDAAIDVLKAAYAQGTRPELAIAIGRLLAESGEDTSALDWLLRGKDGASAADMALQGAIHARLQPTL